MIGAMSADSTRQCVSAIWQAELAIVEEVRVAGDWAFLWGTDELHLTPESGEPEIHMKGKGYFAAAIRPVREVLIFYAPDKTWFELHSIYG